MQDTPSQEHRAPSCSSCVPVSSPAPSATHPGVEGWCWVVRKSSPPPSHHLQTKGVWGPHLSDRQGGQWGLGTSGGSACPPIPLRDWVPPPFPHPQAAMLELGKGQGRQQDSRKAPTLSGWGNGEVGQSWVHGMFPGRRLGAAWEQPDDSQSFPWPGIRSGPSTLLKFLLPSACVMAVTSHSSGDRCCHRGNQHHRGFAPGFSLWDTPGTGTWEAFAG